MRMHRLAPVIGAVSLSAIVVSATATTPRGTRSSSPAGLTCDQMETFLKTAKVVSQKGISVGVTAPTRATLDDGTMKHDASIQTIDVRKTTFEGSRTTELNFRDAWQFNVAGYELAKMLKLNMVPPYVERRVGGKDASLSWWVNDAMMEKDRYQKKIQPPSPVAWNQQMWAARVFHQLIGDTDFNLTNLLISKDWQMWMIDFTRAFRATKTLPDAKELTRADRTLLAQMRTLTAESLQQALGRWIGKMEIEGLLGRRDLIVQFFEKEVAAKGEGVLYDFPRTSESCGTGLQ